MFFSTILLTINSKPLAYLDPGTGSFLLQLLLAGLLAAGLVVRLFWNRIKKLFSKSKPDETEAETEGDDEDDK